jgi:hypothetical protein
LERIKVLMGMISEADCSIVYEGGKATRPALVEIEKYGMGTERSFEDYVTYSGVDFGSGIASGRARMGISDGASSEEIASKYGSFSRFELEKKRITGQ